MNLFVLSILPLTGGSWWFVTAYLLLMLVVPYINPVLKSFEKKKYKYFLLFFFMLWIVFAFIANKYAKAKFYDLQEAIFFYVLGAFLRLFHNRSSYSKCYLMLAFLVVGGGMQHYVFCVIQQLVHQCKLNYWLE